MSQGIIRAAIVGASSLLGKELAERLNDSAGSQWDLKLLEKEDAAGQMTAAGDEAVIIQAITADAFLATDIVFFAGDVASTRENWQDAVKAGAAIVDLTGVLDGEAHVMVRSPLVQSPEPNTKLDLSTLGTVSANPSAIMLGAAISKLQKAFAPIQASATVLQPASQQGNAGMDEMHQQTVSLLSFKSLPQEVFDTQVAFNLSAELGSSATADLNRDSQQIRRHLATVAGTSASKATAMQVLQAPVFSGLTASVFVATASAIPGAEIERALAGDLIHVPAGDDPSPSNQAAAQQDEILVRVQTLRAGSTEPQGFWLWMAADNLRISVRNAIACAAELLSVRPNARVQ